MECGGCGLCLKMRIGLFKGWGKRGYVVFMGGLELF